jgi:DNA topoisomerase II
LGTSEEKDAREYFSNMEKHMISFRTADDEDRKAIELAFAKKQADARKEWLRELEVVPRSEKVSSLA